MDLMLRTCSRCGDCAAACPAQCIVLDPAVDQGLPTIVARLSPCVMCTDLSCMSACGTGALEVVSRSDIRMGLAVVDGERCLRGGRGEDCRLCVSQCPVGATALRIDEDGAVSVGAGCTGCGVCERVCPTEPASIVVRPGQGREAMEDDDHLDAPEAPDPPNATDTPDAGRRDTAGEGPMGEG